MYEMNLDRHGFLHKRQTRFKPNIKSVHGGNKRTIQFTRINPSGELYFGIFLFEKLIQIEFIYLFVILKIKESEE